MGGLQGRRCETDTPTPPVGRDVSPAVTEAARSRPGDTVRAVCVGADALAGRTEERERALLQLRPAEAPLESDGTSGCGPGRTGSSPQWLPGGPRHTRAQKAEGACLSSERVLRLPLFSFPGASVTLAARSHGLPLTSHSGRRPGGSGAGPPRQRSWATQSDTLLGGGVRSESTDGSASALAQPGKV